MNTQIKPTPSPDCPARHKTHGEHLFRLTFSPKSYNGAWIDCAGADIDPDEPRLYYVQGVDDQGFCRTVKTYATSKSQARSNARYVLAKIIGGAWLG